MSLKTLRITLLLLFASPLACDRAGPADYRQQTGPIMNGDLDENPAHQAVVALRIRWTGCSGTLIAPRVVLTAAHCVEDAVAEDFTEMIGTHSDNAFELGVEDFEQHPDYDPGDLAQPSVNDLALLLLAESPPVGVTPIPHLPSYLAIREADIGWPLEYVGFGLTEDGTSGVRMTVVNNLGWICTVPGGCAIGPARAAENTLCQDQRPGGPCSGDSGGPALVSRGGTEYVAGVTSYGDEACIMFGCGTKVDAFQPWIDGFVAGKIGSACETHLECDSGWCAEGVCCDRDCGGACSSCINPGEIGVCISLADDSPCPDGDACNGQEVCADGLCIHTQPLDCFDDNDCTSDACTPGQGCLNPPVDDGFVCDDGLVCNGISTCVSGECMPGQAPDCDDGDPCTDDHCDQALGCVNESVAEQTPCDGGRCGLAACHAGQCTLLDPPSCDDGDRCTLNYCSPQIGCMAEVVQDGTACGDCRECIVGKCVSEPGCKPLGCGCGGRGERGWTGLVLLAALMFNGRRRRRRPVG